MEYWKKKNKLHVQNGFLWGNDLNCNDEEAVWGTYCPMDRSEHIQRGYVQISAEEAAEMAERVGYNLDI